MGRSPSPLPCDPFACGAAMRPLGVQRTSGSEGLMGSVLKSTIKAAKVAGEKQQRTAIASTTKPQRLRKVEMITARTPLQFKGLPSNASEHGEPRAFSLSLEP